jgi:hypothetical protein
VFVEKDAQPIVRIIEVGDVEIHRCDVRDVPALSPVDRNW